MYVICYYIIEMEQLRLTYEEYVAKRKEIINNYLASKPKLNWKHKFPIEKALHWLGFIQPLDWNTSEDVLWLKESPIVLPRYMEAYSKMKPYYNGVRINDAIYLLPTRVPNKDDYTVSIFEYNNELKGFTIYNSDGRIYHAYIVNNTNRQRSEKYPSVNRVEYYAKRVWEWMFIRDWSWELRRQHRLNDDIVELCKEYLLYGEEWLLALKDYDIDKAKKLVKYIEEFYRKHLSQPYRSYGIYDDYRRWGVKNYEKIYREEYVIEYLAVANLVIAYMEEAKKRGIEVKFLYDPNKPAFAETRLRDIMKESG